MVESIPVQNQAAAQKLLEKMNHNGRGDRFARGGKYRGKGKYEEAPVLTLDEWEKRKASANSSMKQGIPDVRQDEDLARQLQNQFDLEDHVSLLSPSIIKEKKMPLSCLCYMSCRFKF